MTLVRMPFLALLAAPFLAVVGQTHAAPEVIHHAGMCDASAAVAIGDDRFLVANDEDDVLRLYARNHSGKPLQSFDLAPFLGDGPDARETDIEGAARIGDRVYWIASHGRSSQGKPRPERLRFFATDLTFDAGRLNVVPAGAPYRTLLENLLAAPGLQSLRLAEAAGRAPEARGGFNIEGLAATPGGALLIAFRNPVPEGRALLVPLENPEQVVRGEAARFGSPLLLALGGRGIRDIARFGDGYLMVAGPYGDEGDFALYRWSGRAADAAEAVPDALPGDLHPEALVVYPGGGVQILSDDGAVRVAGRACKDVDVGQRRFRSTRL